MSTAEVEGIITQILGLRDVVVYGVSVPGAISVCVRVRVLVSSMGSPFQVIVPSVRVCLSASHLSRLLSG